MTDLIKELQRSVGVIPDGAYGPATHRAVMARIGPAAPVRKRQMADPEAFFRGVRAVTGPLNAAQVNTINGLLAGAAHWSIAWLAAGLATAWHEARLVPVEEIGKGRGKPYGRPGKHGGQAPYGRGLVQTTHDVNYEWLDKAAAEAGLTQPGDVLKDFSLALRPDIAALGVIKGMETGAYTGKSLADYLPGERGTFEQFKQSRRIINGTDRWELIADYAMKFQDALSAGGWA